MREGNWPSADGPVIKPEVSAFVYFYLAQRALVFAAVSILAYTVWALAAVPPSPFFFLILFGMFTTIALIFRLFRYEKEAYHLFDTKFVFKSGGLVHDFENELKVRNVTHVVVRQNFIEHQLFGTGDVHIQSAGAQNTEVHLKSIRHSNDVYDRIIDILKTNGFTLTRDTLVQEERPHPLGVFFEVFQMFFGGMLFFFYFVVSALSEEEGELGAMAGAIQPWMLMAAGVAFCGWCAFLAVRFMDISRRRYFLFEDAIAYEEGFLNKGRAIFPMENLADATVTQSFISRIFGLYDITLSCQGSGHGILFANIQNGQRLSDNIDRLLARKKAVPAVENVKTTSAYKASPVQARETADRPEYDRTLTGEYRMQPLRVWLPVLLWSPFLLIAFPVGIAVCVSTVIRLKANFYNIKNDSIYYRNQFFNVVEQEFALEKITGIAIRRGILDRIAGTCSVTFWSIGSDQNIVFSAVPYSDAFHDLLLAKKGMRVSEKLYELPTAFTWRAFAAANIYVLLLAGLGLMVLPVAFKVFIIMVVGGVFVWKKVYYSYQHLDFFKDCTHFRRGWLRREDIYTLYDDVKDITTVRYPFTRTGNITFNVAGETMALAYGSKGGKATLRSNAFRVSYADQIHVMDDMIDTIFYKRPAPQELALWSLPAADASHHAELRAKPALVNALCAHMLWLLPLNAVVLFTGPAYLLLILFDLCVLTGVILSLRMVTSQIQGYRVLQRSGVVFKKQTSVTYNKIDFVNVSRGAFNKLFGNGTITVNTVGSSRPEIVIHNIPNYREFYEVLKKKYEG